MTEREYWIKWTLAGVLALLLARWVLVQPIVNAIHGH
jgi:hypothetical protein